MPVQPKKVTPEDKPSWVKDTSVNPSPVRKVKTPPSSIAKQAEVDVPWRKPNLRKTNPDPPPLLPEPPKPEPKPEWASREKVVLKAPPEKAVKIPITIEATEKSAKPPQSPPSAQKKLKPVPPPSATSNNMTNGKPPPPPPPPGPGPPPPPPPPGLGKPPIPSKVTTPEQQEKLDALRKMARRRPDPYKLMSEIQSGKKLKHVECNDRSRPIIPRLKSFGKFVFDSEAKPASKSDAIHNKLLSDIQQGVKLKKVVTNDRSKPVLQGLRKFRKQATIDDQKGSGSGTPEIGATPPGFPVALADEIDDIDILRDDLQSTKQMLEMELQGKVQLGKVNQDLQCQIITLEAELDKLKAQLGIIPENQVSAIVRRNSRAFKDLRKSKSGLYKSTSGVKKSKSGVGGGVVGAPEPEEDIEEVNELEEEVTALKGLVQLARTSAEDWETKYKEASQKLLVAQGNLEDSEQKRVLLEKKLELAQSRKGLSAVNTIEKTTQTEEQVITASPDRRASKQLRGTSFCVGDSDSEEESSDVELSEEELEKKRQERELKLWENKLKSFKEKQTAAKTERKALKGQQKKMEGELKEAKVRHKELQKEVDKMSKAMAEDADAEEGEGEEDEEEAEEEEEEEEESSSEEEDEEEEDAEESSSEEEDNSEAGHEDRITLYTKRVKRHENILNALRKGNYLLKANIDRLMDSIEEVRIRFLELEHELNTVLALA